HTRNFYTPLYEYIPSYPKGLIMSVNETITIEHEELPNQEPTKETLKTKATNFYRKHKNKVIAGSAVVGGIVTVSVLKSLTSDKDTEQEETTDKDAESYSFTLDATESESDVTGGSSDLFLDYFVLISYSSFHHHFHLTLV